MLRVHLMSAGRLRYHAPGAKTPAKPMFRLRFVDGAELVLTEAGRKKRAGVWLLTETALDAELAHLGPDALGPARAAGGDPARRAAPAAPAPARPARLAGIGRAHANEILWRARLSPFRLSTDLDDEAVTRLAAAIVEDLTGRSRPARREGRQGRVRGAQPAR